MLHYQQHHLARPAGELPAVDLAAPAASDPVLPSRRARRSSSDRDRAREPGRSGGGSCCCCRSRSFRSSGGRPGRTRSSSAATPRCSCPWFVVGRTPVHLLHAARPSRSCVSASSATPPAAPGASRRRRSRSRSPRRIVAALLFLPAVDRVVASPSAWLERLRLAPRLAALRTPTQKRRPRRAASSVEPSCGRLAYVQLVAACGAPVMAATGARRRGGLAVLRAAQSAASS